MAPMSGVPLRHIVDDVVATERSGVGMLGNKVLRDITHIVGWEIIPDDKSPPPIDYICVVGAEVRHTHSNSEIDVAETSDNDHRHGRRNCIHT